MKATRATVPWRKMPGGCFWQRQMHPPLLSDREQPMMAVSERDHLTCQKGPAPSSTNVRREADPADSRSRRSRIDSPLCCGPAREDRLGCGLLLEQLCGEESMIAKNKGVSHQRKNRRKRSRLQPVKRGGSVCGVNQKPTGCGETDGKRRASQHHVPREHTEQERAVPGEGDTPIRQALREQSAHSFGATHDLFTHEAAFSIEVITRSPTDTPHPVMPRSCALPAGSPDLVRRAARGSAHTCQNESLKKMICIDKERYRGHQRSMK
jgi:hypothetical protein